MQTKPLLTLHGKILKTQLNQPDAFTQVFMTDGKSVFLLLTRDKIDR